MREGRCNRPTNVAAPSKEPTGGAPAEPCRGNSHIAEIGSSASSNRAPAEWSRQAYATLPSLWFFTRTLGAEFRSFPPPTPDLARFLRALFSCCSIELISDHLVTSTEEQALCPGVRQRLASLLTIARPCIPLYPMLHNASFAPRKPIARFQ